MEKNVWLLIGLQICSKWINSWNQIGKIEILTVENKFIKFGILYWWCLAIILLFNPDHWLLLFIPLIMYYEKSFNDNKIPIIPRPSLHTQLHQAVGDTNIKYNARCHSVRMLWHREVSWLIFDRTDVCKINILPKFTSGRGSLHS